MLVAARGRHRRSGRCAVVILLAVGVIAMALAALMIFPYMSRHIAAIPGAPSRRITPGDGQFSYGFDFAQRGPYSGPQFNASAVASAYRVLSSIRGMSEDNSSMAWGLPGPEPRSGCF